jgi:threonyl-tRNA synthetase
METQKDAVLIKVGDALKDLDYTPAPGESVEHIGLNDPLVLPVLRHSCAHLLAQAVLELFPNAQVGVGPALDDSFYYDFLVEHPFTPEDLESITKRMRHLVKQNVPVRHLLWTKAEAIGYFTAKNQPLKVELINEKVEGDQVSLYQQGDFVDLCRGPHLSSTRFLKNFKLLSVAAAYWKGDEKSHSMQRIYGTVFADEQALEAYLAFLKEAAARDHRKLGKDLDLFSIQNDVGAGIVLWHPKGSMIRHQIESYWKDAHLANGYELVYTPHVAKLDLWETSGHNGFYRENMFPTIEFDNVEYQLKPMNCPFHLAIFKSRNRSYKEMPFRWAELGTVYRYERSGVLHGLMRVRGFTQDDAHIFCTPQQLEAEIGSLLTFTLDMLRTFGFGNVDIYLSTQPEKSVGSQDKWDLATQALQNALDAQQVPYQVDPGEGVFYGPKIDIKIKDVLGRSWQCSTIQVDFNLPERFALKYSDDQGSLQQPIMIHRALLGSLERFFGILIEHYAGSFPLWLSPLHAVVLPVTDRAVDYARGVAEALRKEGLRVETDQRSEGVGRKIRDAEMQKVPYIVIVGDEEAAGQYITYRIHKQGDKGKINMDQFVNLLKGRIAARATGYEE